VAFNLIPGGADQNSVTTTVNQTILELKNQDVTKVFKDEEGTRVVVLDKNGLRTTAPGSGIDVVTAADGDLTFNSAFNTFRISRTAAVTSTAIPFNVPANTIQAYEQIDTYTHSLGYFPRLIGVQLNYIGGQTYSLPNTDLWYFGNFTSTSCIVTWGVRVTSTTVSIVTTLLVDNASSAIPTTGTTSAHNFRLYLLEQTN
jgi:hypothetical protein